MSDALICEDCSKPPVENLTWRCDQPCAKKCICCICIARYHNSHQVVECAAEAKHKIHMVRQTASVVLEGLQTAVQKLQGCGSKIESELASLSSLEESEQWHKLSGRAVHLQQYLHSVGLTSNYINDCNLFKQPNTINQDVLESSGVVDSEPDRGHSNDLPMPFVATNQSPSTSYVQKHDNVQTTASVSCDFVVKDELVALDFLNSFNTGPSMSESGGLEPLPLEGNGLLGNRHRLSLPDPKLQRRRPYKECKFCHRNFRADYLQKHMRTHDGRRNYKCATCHAVYDRKMLMNECMKYHMGQGYKCKHCGLHIRFFAEYKQHYNSEHSDKTLLSSPMKPSISTSF